MDDLSDMDVLWPRKRRRYRVAITIIDAQEQQASVAIYDTNTVEISSGPAQRDRSSGQMLAEVRLRMPAALHLSEADDNPEP